MTAVAARPILALIDHERSTIGGQVKAGDPGGGDGPPAPSRHFWFLAPAVIGLLGVLVGALVTSGIAYLGDRNRRIADLRMSRRLVATEIRLDVELLNLGYATGRLVEPLHASAWGAQEATLARQLSDRDWAAVNQFYIDVTGFGSLLTVKRCATESTRYSARGIATVFGKPALAALGDNGFPTEQINKTRCR